MPDRRAAFRIEANAQNAVRGIQKLARGFKGLRKESLGSSRAFASMNRNSLSLGASLRAPLGGLVAFGGAALAIHKARQAFEQMINVAGRFESRMAAVRTITDVSDDEFRNLNATTVALAKSLGVDASDAARGLYQVISGGVRDVAEAQKVLEVATKLSVGGEADQAAVTKLLTVILKAYRLETDQAAGVADKLFTTVRLGITTMEEIAGSLGNVIGTAATAGVQLDELLTTLAILTQAGLSTDEAVTSINSALRGIAAATPQARKAMERLGVDVSEARLKTDGLLTVLTEIAKVAQGSLELTKELFPNDRAVRAIASLDAERLEDFASALEEMRGSAGAADKAFETMQGTMEGLRRQVESVQNTVRIALETGLRPYIKTYTESVRDLGESLLGWLIAQDGINTVATTTGKAVAALVAGTSSLAVAALEAAKAFITLEEGLPKFELRINEIRVGILTLLRSFDRLQLRAAKFLGREAAAEIPALEASIAGYTDEIIRLSNEGIGALADVLGRKAEINARIEQIDALAARTVAFLEELNELAVSRLPNARKEIVALYRALFGFGDGNPFDDFDNRGANNLADYIRSVAGATEEAAREAQANIRNAAGGRFDDLGDELRKKTSDSLANGIAAGLAQGRQSASEFAEHLGRELLQNTLSSVLGRIFDMLLGVPVVGIAAAAAGRSASQRTDGASAMQRAAAQAMESLRSAGANAVGRPGPPIVNVTLGAETVVEVIQAHPSARRTLYRDVVRPESQTFQRP